jgi:uncharacterized protein
MDDRINKINKSEKFQYSISKIGELEISRSFCRHGIEHYLDVARIAYIICLENSLNIKKDVIYAAALLHDIGRWMQYEHGIPHEIASSSLAYDILIGAGYDNNEIESIQKAIMNHRSSNEDMDLCSIIYISDKVSRGCFYCSSEKECNWSSEKKNKAITY